MTARRVALIAPAGSYVGPDLALLLARRGYDLVLAQGAKEAVDAARAHGATVVEVEGPSAGDPGMGTFGHDIGAVLAAAAVERFGTYHSAFFSSGRIALGKFLKMTEEDLHGAFAGNVVAPFHFVQQVLPRLVEQQDGQVLVATSATAGRPTASASVYAATRSAATILLQSAAMEIADRNVQLNVIGTNFMDFPEFLRGNRVKTPQDRERVESMVPMKRLGSMGEFAAHCAVYLDSTSRFTTGQFIPYAGGWAV